MPAQTPGAHRRSGDPHTPVPHFPSMLSALDHGFTGLFFAYGLALLGVFAGLRFRHESLTAFKMRLPLNALFALAAALLLWVAIGELNLLYLGQAPPWAREFLGASVVVLVGILAGLRAALPGTGLIVHRGTRLLERSDHTPERDAGAPSFPTFAGQSVPPADETKHFKVLGTTGTGKSTAIRELLRGALARGDRAVIADPDGGYGRSFYDPQRGDAILNPFDPRAHRWDLMAEIIQLHDADQLARSIIPDYEGTDRNWRHYARTFLTAVLRQLHRLENHDLAQLYHLLVLAPPAELRELIGTTPAGSFLGEGDKAQEGNRFFESVRSVANVHAAALEHIARQQTGELLSVRRWVREGRGVLFLPYRASEIDALRDLVSTWMRLAIFETMNAEEGDRRLWFVVDELDALGAIDGLKDALARLRKFGGRCVLGFQSIAQV